MPPLTLDTSELARRAGELALALGGAWDGGGKGLARHLDDAAPGLNVCLHHAVRGALNGQTEALVGVVEDVLARAGGRLRAGYRRSGTL